jgi:hypothetical protein
MKLDAPTLFFSVSLYALLGAIVIAFLRRRLTAGFPGLRRTAAALGALAVCNLPVTLSLMGGRDQGRLNAGLTVFTWVATAMLMDGLLGFHHAHRSRRRFWMGAGPSHSPSPDWPPPRWSRAGAWRSFRQRRPRWPDTWPGGSCARRAGRRISGGISCSGR